MREGMIEITGVDLRELVKKAYDLSEPRGMGMLHFEAGPLPESSVDDILARGTDKIPVSMDYVKGRAVKLTVWHFDDKLYLQNSWFDHSESDLLRLLSLANAG